MNTHEEIARPAEAVSDACAWTGVLAGYRRPDNGRSIVEIGITIVPLVLLWLLIWATLDLGYWLSMLLAVPAAGFLVRLFMIQHDCGHGAFFRRRRANDWVGRIIGVLTLTPTISGDTATASTMRIWAISISADSATSTR